jgi:copper chaperone CopZ
MKYLIHSTIMLLALLVLTCCDAQIQHAKTVSVTVFGDCGMCEKTIEKAAAAKGDAKADWDMDTKIAQITFDSTTTNLDAVLQRIAAAGYDSEHFTAPDTSYTNLPTCCQYERPVKAALGAVPESKPMNGMVKKMAKPVDNPLTAVYTAYFSIKDALVATDGKVAATAAKSLLDAISKVQMEALTAPQHELWMKKVATLNADAQHIQELSNPDKQRIHFSSLTSHFYEIMKAVPPGNSVYFDYCPMYNNGKGGNWLSLEEDIKNPYFGNKMLHCGSTTEVLK